MIEKKILIFGLFVLFLLPASALAADGDSSPESTIVLRETLPDDIMFYPDNETHGTGLAESFTDVSDWIKHTDGEAEDTLSTDGDAGTFDFNYAGGTDYDQFYVNNIGLSGGYYVEIRYKTNITGSWSYLRGHEGTTPAGAYVWSETLVGSLTWKTLKVYKSGAFNVLIIRSRLTSTNLKVEIDYLRIGPADEMGWQHDGSTTAGFDYLNNAQLASDSDKLNISNVAAGGYYARLDLYGVDLDHYPFLGFSLTDSNTTISIGAKGLDAGASYVTVQGYASLSAGMYHYNLVGAGVADYDAGVMIYVRGGAAGWTQYDWIKLYSIANFTVTQSGVGTDDYLYVSGGVLTSTVDSGYIELDHDPTLSVAPDTYPLYYNLITIGTAPEFSMYVSSWSTYSDETRGIISSRIVTDIKLKFDSTEIISEIMFAMDDISIFDELFLSLDMWGYLGPMAMIVIGYVLARKEKFLGVLWFAVECLFVSQYLTLVEAMPNYWWHIFILILGGLFTCVYPLLDR